MQTISRKELTSARWVYFTLLLAPVLAVPFSLFNMSDIYSDNILKGMILGTVVPLIFYLPVFLMARARKGLFVSTHARQGIVLIFLRFLSWMAFVTSLITTTNMWFLLFNAFLWLVGSLVGLSQVNKGRSWLGGLHVNIEPEPSKIMNLPVGAQRQEFVAAALKVAEAGHTPMHRADVVQILLEDFRAGNAEARQRAIKGLETLGEVESF